MKKHYSIFLFIAITVNFVLVSSANSTPTETTCRLVAALESSPEKFEAEFSDATSHWPDHAAAQLKTKVFPQTRALDFMKTEAFQVGSIGTMMEEHLFVASTPDLGAIYFRLVYEVFGNKKKLARFNFNDSFVVIAEVPFLETPKLISCN